MTIREIIYVARDKCELMDLRGRGNQHIRLGACSPFGLELSSEVAGCISNFWQWTKN